MLVVGKESHRDEKMSYVHRGLGGNRARGCGRTESGQAKRIRAMKAFNANELLREKPTKKTCGNERSLVTGVPVIDVNRTLMTRSVTANGRGSSR